MKSRVSEIFHNGLSFHDALTSGRPFFPDPQFGAGKVARIDGAAAGM